MSNENAGVVLKSGHSSLTSACRTPGFKITDMHGGMGVIPKVKTSRIKAMSLSELFKIQ
ncbi:hypothetical protein D9M68_19310 [compost metagenome]